jgi:molybdenum cofactor synthesis domain-containing protein
MRSAGVIIASTRAANGIYQDECGPLLADALQQCGFEVLGPHLAADGEPVRAAFDLLLRRQPSVIITSGGTGLSPDDVTPEITAALLERPLPGIMEAIRAAGRSKTPLAALSRGYAGSVGRTLVVNLPGSPGGVRDGLEVLTPLLDHICVQLEGGNPHG